MFKNLKKKLEQSDLINIPNALETLSEDKNITSFVSTPFKDKESPSYSSPNKNKELNEYFNDNSLPQSDIESEISSEVGEESSIQDINIDVFSKEQLFFKVKRVLTQLTKYRGRYSEVTHAYKILENERQKMHKALSDYQDVSIKKINELKETILINQEAKTLLEISLKKQIESKDAEIELLKMKIDNFENRVTTYTSQINDNILKSPDSTFSPLNFFKDDTPHFEQLLEPSLIEISDESEKEQEEIILSNFQIPNSENFIESEFDDKEEDLECEILELKKRLLFLQNEYVKKVNEIDEIKTCLKEQNFVLDHSNSENISDSFNIPSYSNENKTRFNIVEGEKFSLIKTKIDGDGWDCENGDSEILRENISTQTAEYKNDNDVELLEEKVFEIENLKVLLEEEKNSRNNLFESTEKEKMELNAKIKNECAKYEIKLEDLQNKIKDLKEENDKNKNETQSTSQQNQNKILKLENEIEKLSFQRINQEKEFKIIQEKCVNLEKNLLVLENSKKELQDTLAKGKRIVIDKEKENFEFGRKLKEINLSHEKVVKDCKEELDETKNALMVKVSQINNLFTENKNLKKEIKNLLKSNELDEKLRNDIFTQTDMQNGEELNPTIKLDEDVYSLNDKISELQCKLALNEERAKFKNDFLSRISTKIEEKQFDFLNNLFEITSTKSTESTLSPLIDISKNKQNMENQLLTILHDSDQKMKLTIDNYDLKHEELEKEIVNLKNRMRLKWEQLHDLGGKISFYCEQNFKSALHELNSTLLATLKERGFIQNQEQENFLNEIWPPHYDIEKYLWTGPITRIIKDTLNDEFFTDKISKNKETFDGDHILPLTSIKDRNMVMAESPEFKSDGYFNEDSFTNSLNSNYHHEQFQHATTSSNPNFKERTLSLESSSTVASSHHSIEPPPLFPETSELEYLRKIIYEYIMGYEPLTMVKVLSAVLKFPDDKKTKIVEREKLKNKWYSS